MTTDEVQQEGLLINGRYRLGDCLGQGKIGSVYRAVDQKTGAPVSIKIPHPRHASNPEFAARFRRRYQTGLRVQHPSLVRCLDAGEFGGIPYLVNELVEGQGLLTWFEESGRDFELLAELLDRLLEGLAAAHQQRIYHQELKPSNILVTTRGEPRIQDLGLAGRLEDQLGPAQLYLESLVYLSPEQAVGARGDERSDLYSLGAILYHLASGRPPFTGKTSAELLLAHLSEPPAALSQIRSNVPSWLEELIGRLLQPSPADRPASATEVRNWVGRRRTLVRSSGEEALPSFFGREAELVLWEQALDDLREGIGTSFWLSAPLGSGRTRLLQEFARRSAGFPRVFLSRMPQALESRPLIVLVDDADRLDEGTLLRLAGLVESARTSPLLVVAAAAPKSLPALRGKFARELTFPGLDRESCAALMEERLWAPPPPEVVAWFSKASDGNPYFLKLLLERLEGNALRVDLGEVRWKPPGPDEIPSSLQGMLAKMLEEEGPEARELLGLCACLAKHPYRNEAFEGNLLRAVVIYSKRQLEAFVEGLVRRGWLQEGWVDGVITYRFPHPARWQAALEGFPERRRRRIHLLVGAFLERSLRSLEDYERAAAHYEDAREFESALRMLCHCLADAVDREAWPEARLWMKRCQAAALDAPESLRADLVFPKPWGNFGWAGVQEPTGPRHFLAAQLLQLGRPDEALWQLQIAWEEGLEDDPHRQIENHLLKVVAHLRGGEISLDETMTHLKQALELAQETQSEATAVCAALQIRVHAEEPA